MAIWEIKQGVATWEIKQSIATRKIKNKEYQFPYCLLTLWCVTKLGVHLHNTEVYLKNS